jgi:hypothetical protein
LHFAHFISLMGRMLIGRMRRTAGRAALGAALVAAAGLYSGGCALLPLGGRPDAAPGGRPSPMGRGLFDYRVAFHCHSLLSHDSKVPFDEISAAARRLGFNAVILDDHYAPGNIARSPHGRWDGTLFIPGVEIRPDRLPDGSPDEGSLLIFGIERDFDPQMGRVELSRALAARGAVVVAGHCEDFRGWDRYPLEAFEVYNLHTQFKLASRWGIAFRFIFFLADPFFEGGVDPPRFVLDRYDARLAEGKRLAVLAGHDAHANIRLFGPLGGTIGTYPELLRLFSNHLLAPRLESEDLLEAVRRGRTYISFDFLGDGSGFLLSYAAPEEKSGQPGPGAAILGEEAAYRPGHLLRVETPLEGRIRVLKDGALWQSARGRRFDPRPPGPGIYRVEVDRKDRWGSERLWIVSAPIYLVEKKA